LLITPLAIGIDVFQKKLHASKVIFPVVLSFVGTLLAVWEGSFSAFIELSVAAFVVVGLGKNLFSLSSEYEERAGGLVADAVNLYCWRFFYLAIASTIGSLSISAARGTLGELFSLMYTSYWPAVIPITAVMIMLFLSRGWSTAAKKKGIVSIVLVVRSIQVFFAYVFIGIGNSIQPGYFQALPTDGYVWLIRVLGLLLLLLSIQLLQRAHRQ
jgi:hypothetical protein